MKQQCIDLSFNLYKHLIYRRGSQTYKVSPIEPTIFLIYSWGIMVFCLDLPASWSLCLFHVSLVRDKLQTFGENQRFLPCSSCTFRVLVRVYGSLTESFESFQSLRHFGIYLCSLQFTFSLKVQVTYIDVELDISSLVRWSTMDEGGWCFRRPQSQHNG